MKVHFISNSMTPRWRVCDL